VINVALEQTAACPTVLRTFACLQTWYTKASSISPGNPSSPPVSSYARVTQKSLNLNKEEGCLSIRRSWKTVEDLNIGRARRLFIFNHDDTGASPDVYASRDFEPIAALCQS
jgi:hypothetical protein